MSGLEVRTVPAGDLLNDSGIAAELAQSYYLWDAFVSGEPRVSLHPIVLSPALHSEAVHTAQTVAQVVGTVAERAYDSSGECALYGLPNDVVGLAQASREAGDVAGLFRVDLLLGVDGKWRACEINADCPGGHNEAIGLGRLALAAGMTNARNPTHVVEALATRILRMARRADGTPGLTALIYATAYAEDLQVCALVKREIERRGGRAVLASPTAPQLRDGQVRVCGEQVDVLYRFFPAEYMEGNANVAGLTQAIRSGALRTVSSFAHIFTQSKLALARAWSLRGELSESDASAVEEMIPESQDIQQLGAEKLCRERGAWVVKKAYGRVGEEVLVGELTEPQEWQRAVREIERLRGNGESWIAQRFVPQQPLKTPWGRMLVTLGAYVLDGVFVGYFARLSPVSHVSHHSLCVPVFVGEPS